MNKVLFKIIQIKRYLIRRYYLMLMIIESYMTSLKARFHPDKIYIDQPYQGQKILLIALYQKSVLRPDIIRLLLTAKKLGYFVIGANTLKLSKPETLTDYFDLYLERFNFGRDFGSYQSAFLLLFKRKYQTTCPRLLMLNDSVYYESSRTPKFLEDLMNSELEVLGASENHNLRHHLGSFCISYSSRIIKHPAFIQFWKNYRNSDVRPIVIDKGEKGLTQCLKRIVTEPNCLQALYEINRLVEVINSNKAFLDLAFRLTCRTGTVQRLSAKKTWTEFQNQYYFYKTIPDQEPLDLYEIDSYLSYLKNKVNMTDPELESKAKTFILSKICNAFSVHSQIHTNAVLMMHLGLPLVKLDGYFRGAFSEENIFELCDLMSPEEAVELKKLLFSRPYGLDNLVNRERTLFEVGFI